MTEEQKLQLENLQKSLGTELMIVPRPTTREVARVAARRRMLSLVPLLAVSAWLLAPRIGSLVATLHAPRSTCVALSIGGPAGMAEIGALDALRDRHVPVSAVFGNSMGAVIGGCYASAPQADLSARYRAVVAAYAEATRREKVAAGVGVGTLVALGLMVASDGAVGFDTLVGGAAAGLVASNLFVKDFDLPRFREALDTVLSGARLERLAVRFGTSSQHRVADGLALSVDTVGPVAEAVCSSANNPFIWGLEESLERGSIDPGADRMAATPVEEAFRTFHPDRIIAINVTGQPAAYTAAVTCTVVEIQVPVGPVTEDAVNGTGPDFQRLYAAGYEAVRRAEL